MRIGVEISRRLREKAAMEQRSYREGAKIPARQRP